MTRLRTCTLLRLSLPFVFASLMLTWIASPALAQPARSEIDSRISEIQRELAALEKEHYQHSVSIDSNRKKLEEAQASAEASKPWEQALAGFQARMDEKRKAFEEACERYNYIPPEDRSWLDEYYLGFIKAPQRRIPRELSRMYDKLASKVDWLTFHRTIDAELRAGIRFEGDPVLRKFDGLAEFLAKVDAAALQSGLAADDCITYRGAIAGAGRRLLEIDAQKSRLRRELDDLKRRLDQMEAAPPPVQQADAPEFEEPEIVDAICSQIEGSPGGRVAFWRFYIRLALRNNVPVELRLNSIKREPEAQDPDAKRRFPAPTAAFSVKPGESLQLGGWQDPVTGVPILEHFAETGDEAAFDAPRVAGTRTLGPYYLTVWEEHGFQGKLVAEFETVRGAPTPMRLSAEFVPPPPPTTRMEMEIISPEPDERVGPAGATMKSFAWNDAYHVRLVVRVPGLPVGAHRLRIQVRGHRDRFLWARVKEGEAQTTFNGFVPLGVGPYELTLSVPGAPQVAPTTISGRLEPMRGSVEGLAGSARRVRDAESNLGRTDGRAAPYLLQWWLGDALLVHAQKLNIAGQSEEALATAEKAIELLPEFHVGAKYTSGAGSNYQHLAWHEKAFALYHLDQRDAFREAMQHIALISLNLASEHRQAGNEAVAKDYERQAGDCYHLMAHRLMLLGVDLPEIERIVETGNQYYRQAQKNPPKLIWLPG